MVKTIPPSSMLQGALWGLAAYVGMREIAVPELMEYVNQSLQFSGQEPYYLSEQSKSGVALVLGIPCLVAANLADYAHVVTMIGKGAFANLRRESLILHQRKERQAAGFDTNTLALEDLLGPKAQEAERLKKISETILPRLESSFLDHAIWPIIGYAVGGAILNYIRAAASTGQWNV